MGKFGWSYPPGCSGPPDDEREFPPEYEALWQHLEEAGIDQAVLMRLDTYVATLLGEASKECHTCLARFLAEEADTYRNNDVAGV